MTDQRPAGVMAGPRAITRVPLIKPDLPSFDAVADEFREVLESGQITNFGKYVTQLENEAGAFLGAEVVTVSSGTTGLILALQALGVGPGTSVVLPSFTFMATAQAVRYTGAVPVFAEIEADLTMSPSDLEALLERVPNVAAVVPVHTYGLPCRVDALQSVVDAAAARASRPIAVLYDAAHGFGSATADGRKVGSFGNAEVFSLSATKLLVSIEGGMISTLDSALAHRLRKMRNYGIEANYNAHFPGVNGKMSELHAIVGVHNLRRISELIAEREWRARVYAARIQQQTSFCPAPMPTGVRHTFKDFTIIVPGELATKRASIMACIADRGVESRAYFSPPIHEQEFFRSFAQRPLPRTEDLSRRVVTLPFYTSMTELEMDYVVDALVLAEREARRS